MKKEINEQDLLDLKEDINQAKEKVSELKGSRNSVLENLNEQWNCSSIEEAEKKLESLKKELEEIDAKIERGVEEIKEKYEL